MTSSLSQDFYATVPLHTDFSDILDSASYAPVPDDWWVGTADIVGSTVLVSEGRYKEVNTIGAAVISAQINCRPGVDFPFVFGGDGASFAVPASEAASAREALATTARWALTEFGIEMRAAMVPVSAIREAGFDVRVARFGVNTQVDYAMFEGGGLSYAERIMKEGQFAVEISAPGTAPDLEGLSCRWTPMKATNGAVLSLVIFPEPQADEGEIAACLHRVVDIVETLDRGGHPVPVAGPGFRWPPHGLEIEAKATHGQNSLFMTKMKLLFATFLALIFFKTGWKAGEFDPQHYVETVAQNADFRKFDDGLKMTIDCDPETRQKIEAELTAAQNRGLLKYGLVEQEDAIMTCFVPSITNDDHVHFVDGASGGYTGAAALVKQATAQQS